eukprot:CAMPEP_0115056194 /NCGR_PEP_ID=MMETSP0227-20121206/5056_1 /TAXON_ID=89957 /ORGANISM="Polarella glacialis, Strain CCMP 1383" /LENGTH=113 /DNA_ID=CAMNT_0002440837 /DNA_START=291 /DNA_END=632 /DNA_ORIENTATION=+
MLRHLQPELRQHLSTPRIRGESQVAVGLQVGNCAITNFRRNCWRTEPRLESSLRRRLREMRARPFSSAQRCPVAALAPTGIRSTFELRWSFQLGILLLVIWKGVNTEDLKRLS